MNIPCKKLKDAVNSLILSNPLFAGILIQQKFVEDNSEGNPTFSVDGKTFAYNSSFADSLSFDECKAVCAHEAMHLALLHHVRMGKRDCENWNKATDFAINSELAKQGFKLPKDALLDAKFADKSAEDIYRELAQAQKPKSNPQNHPKPSQNGKQSQPNSGQSQPSQGQGKPSNGNPSQGQANGQGAPSMGQVKPSPIPNAKAAEAKAKGQIEKAMSIARMAGSLPACTERAIKASESPRMDWREILHRFFQEITQRDYSFTSPNSRFLNRGIILPSLRSRDIGRIILAVDTSGSVSDSEVSAMVSEMQNCMETYCDAGLSDGLTVIYCDAAVTGEETLYSGDVANPKGGGGTMFAPVFERLANDLGNAACLVYLTDGYCGDSMDSLAKLSPSFPVLWGLICDNPTFSQAVPFGECFKMDIHA